MNLESIRKIWVMIGSVVVALNVSWIPDIITGVFSAEGTELVFAAIGAVIALFQFAKSRTGEGKPQALTAGDKAPGMYWLPWASA